MQIFDSVMRLVSSVIGLLLVVMGGIWFLQGTGLAFQVGFMAGAPQWALYGAVLAAVGICQVVWSVRRRR